MGQCLRVKVEIPKSCIKGAYGLGLKLRLPIERSSLKGESLALIPEPLNVNPKPKTSKRKRSIMNKNHKP